MAQQIQLRHDTAANWTAANPILMVGEMGVETDTGQFKIGNGSQNWSALAYGGLVGPAQTLVLEDFGDGSDGDATISASVVTLVKDTYYNNLTISGTGKIITNGYRLFVKSILDISAAGTYAIQNPGNPGAAAVAQTGGVVGAATLVNTIGNGGSGTAGATGVVGVGAQSVAPVALTPANGGATQTGGAGGTGTSGAGGATRAGATATNPTYRRSFTQEMIRGITLLLGGAGGPGGGSGAGDGVNLGRGGGAGGGGGSMLWISAKSINRSGSTPASAIFSDGGDGGAGATGVAGNVGGGGGGSAGGGGFVYLAYQSLSGTTATNCITANGGTGGNGGSGFGTGGGGSGGGGGNGGAVFVLKTDTATGNLTIGTVGLVGNAAVGISGGTGGTKGLCQVSL